MGTYYLPIVLTIISNVFYHIFQKSTPVNVNPVLSLAVTYLAVALICISMFPFFKDGQNLLSSLKSVNWASFALGFAIVGLEMGFLMAYRAGWNISMAGIVSNIAVGLLLIPIGLLFYYERLSFVNITGIILCLGGLVLINLQ